MQDDTAIKVSNINKTFILPHQKNNSIKQALINIGKSGYEKQHVLNDVSFEVKKGEFFGIVGRNGSGKSTLLKILSGIYTPTSGEVKVNGRLTPFIELGVGFNPELTGRDNVFLNGALLGFSRKEMEASYDSIVKFAGLERFMDQKLKNYSSGMQVRLAFSIAIRADTDILVLDEVLAVGDTNFQNKCFDYFNKIKNKKTVILVSHDMNSIKRFCDRALLLEKSKVMEVSDGESIALRYGGIMADDEIKAVKEKTGTGIHVGSREVVINKVCVLDDSGKEVDVVAPGKKFAVRVDLDMPKNFKKDLGFIITLFNGQGQKLFSANTFADNIEVNPGKVKNNFTLEISNKVLAPGIYKLNAGVFDRTITSPYDHFRDAAEFTVAGARKSDSNIVMPYEWKV